MLVQPEREQLIPYLEPQETRRVVESRNVVFIETPQHLLPPSKRLSSLQGLEASMFDFSYNSLDDNYTSREDMIQDVQDYINALDFDANDPTELLIPMQASPGGSAPGGVTPRDYRLPLHLYLRLRQSWRLHPRLHRRHRKQPPRASTITPCIPVLRALLHAAKFVCPRLMSLCRQ